MSDDPKNPWPSGQRDTAGEQEILGPEETGPDGRGSGWGSGEEGPWGPSSMRMRILSGRELKNWGMLGCGAVLAIMSYCMILLFAAVIGLNDWLGFLGALAGIVLALMLRTSIPIIIGAFLCAYKVWGWGWLGSAIFAAPLLVLAVPFLSWSILRVMMRRRFNGR